MERVRTLVTNSGVKAVITFPEFKDELSALFTAANCRVLSTDDVPEIESASTKTQEC